MAVASFQVLCEGVCGLFGVAPPRLQADANGLTGFTLQVQDVDISVVEGPAGTTPAVLLLVEFGAPPAGRELQAWHTLLDANFLLLGAHAPCFSRNPVTGDVVLQQASALQDVSCEALVERIRSIAEVAARWRQDPFLGEPPAAGDWPGNRPPGAAMPDSRPGASVFA